MAALGAALTAIVVIASSSWPSAASELEEGAPPPLEPSLRAAERALALRFLRQSQDVWRGQRGLQSAARIAQVNSTSSNATAPRETLSRNTARGAADPDAPRALERLTGAAARRDLDGYYQEDMEAAFKTKRFLEHHLQDFRERKSRQESDTAFSSRMARAQEAQIPSIVEKEREAFETRLHEAFRDNAARRELPGHAASGSPASGSHPPSHTQARASLAAPRPANKLRDTVIQGR